MRGEGTAYKQDGSRFWWIQWYVQGKRFTESSKSEDEKVARRLLRKKLAAVEAGELTSGSRDTLLSLYEALERDYTINHRKDLANLQSRWANHLKPAFAEKTVSTIDQASISEYVATRQEQGAANATINRELAIVKRMYKLAVKTGRLKVGQQPYIEMLKERNVRKGFVKDEQYEALVRETGKIGLWLRAMFELAYTYGWRKSELLNMKVAQIDIRERLEDCAVLLNPGETKNDQARTAPMTERVRELLKACIVGKTQDDYVFTRERDHRGRKPKTAYIVDFRDDWNRACVRAGVGKFFCLEHKLELVNESCPTCGEVRDGGRYYQGLLVHDLCRTGIRNMRRNGISEKVAMTIAGRRTRSVFERYNIVDPNDLSEAGRIMNRASLTRPRTDFRQLDMSFQSESKPN